MKNIFKKNQIIITALAIMIAIAGYLNFSTKNSADKVADVANNETLDYNTYTETAGDNILDGSTVSLDESADAVADESATGDEVANVDDVGLLDVEALDPTNSEDVAQSEENDIYADISDEDASSDEVAQYEVSDTGEVVLGEEETSAPGEAILVSTTISPNFFAAAKLKREQTRSLNKETFLLIMNNENIADDAKETAISGLINLTAIAEKEDATETQLQAKGFSDAVVSIIDGKVDVIINAASVTEQDIAKAEDIIKRNTGVESTQIVISAVVMED